MRYENALTVANGDYVMLHGRFSNTGLPANWIVVDVVRLQNGMLAEHWDVVQDEVTAEQPKFGLPMFGDSAPTASPKSSTSPPGPTSPANSRPSTPRPAPP